MNTTASFQFSQRLWAKFVAKIIIYFDFLLSNANIITDYFASFLFYKKEVKRFLFFAFRSIRLFLYPYFLPSVRFPFQRSIRHLPLLLRCPLGFPLHEKIGVEMQLSTIPQP